MPTLSPLKTRDIYLQSMKELGDRYYDAEYRLLTFPVHPNVHIEYLDASVRHCTRESLYYALTLLLIGGGENIERAAQITQRITEAR